MLRFFNISLLLLLTACAQVVAPTGGVTDNIPPKVLAYEPALQSLNLRENGFTIRFNEYISIRDADKQLIVSPPLRNPPVLKPRGKSLLVSWDDTLKTNTTYVFQFGGSVVDITEGNATTDLRMVFSTGDRIDTAAISGKIVSARSGEPAKEFTVMLYDSLQAAKDSFVAKMLPSYFARTGADGVFTVENVRQGSYRIVAIKDGNKNYLYDDYNEGIAFCDTPVMATAEPKPIVLKSFVAAPVKQYLKSYDFSDRHMFRFVMNKPMETFSIRQYGCPDIDKMAFTEFVSGSDSAVVWFKDSLACDSLHIIPLSDGRATDTIHASLRNLQIKAKGKTGTVVRNKRNVAGTNINAGKSVQPAEGLRLRFAPPVQAYHSGKAWLFSGKDSTPVDFIPADSLRHTWRLSARLLTDTQYSLLVLPGAFLLKNGYASDTIRCSFSLLSPDATGKLSLLLSHDSGFPLLIRLLDASGKTMRLSNITQTDDTLAYDMLLPGKYAVEAIEDRNGNGRWDTGDYYSKLQPEQVWKFSEEIEIRASWELEKTWHISH